MATLRIGSYRARERRAHVLHAAQWAPTGAPDSLRVTLHAADESGREVSISLDADEIEALARFLRGRAAALESSAIDHAGREAYHAARERGDADPHAAARVARFAYPSRDRFPSVERCGSCGQCDRGEACRVVAETRLALRNGAYCAAERVREALDAGDRDSADAFAEISADCVRAARRFRRCVA